MRWKYAILKITCTVPKCNNLLYECKKCVDVIKIFKPVTGTKCVYTKFKQRNLGNLNAKMQEIILCDLITVAYNKQAKSQHVAIWERNYPNTLQTIPCNILLQGSYHYCNGYVRMAESMINKLLTPRTTTPRVPTADQLVKSKLWRERTNLPKNATK